MENLGYPYPIHDKKLARSQNDADCISAYCRHRALFDKPTGRVIEMNCKSWRCPRHRGFWLWRWQLVVNRELEVNPVDKLITLTLADDASPVQLNRARQVLSRALRHRDPAFAYLAVLEFTTRTRLPHLHLLARLSYLPQVTLSEEWQKATAAAGCRPAPIVYIERPKSQGGSTRYALAYALNGTAKHQDIPDYWRGRKITYSKNFFMARTARQHYNDYLEERHGVKLSSTNWEIVPKDFDPENYWELPTNEEIQGL